MLVAAGFLAMLAVLRPHRPPPPVGERREDTRGFVTGDGAALKKAPASGSETLGRVASGAKVALVRDLGRWYEIKTEKGDVGFVAAESVEKESDRDARKKRARTIAAFPAVYGLVAEDTAVLLAPYPQAAQDGRLARGSVIPIHSVDHSYYAFQTKSGEIAFVNSADVDLVPQDPSKPEIKPGSVRAVKDLTVEDSAPPPPEEPAPPAEPVGPPRDASDAGHRPPTPAPQAEGGEALLVTKVEPSYPERARRAGIEGTVELEVTIGVDGSVTNVDVVRGLPLGVSEAAADAVRRWKYRPARGKDGPIVSRRPVRILFTLAR